MTALYQRALGSGFDALPEALRHFHGTPGCWRGVAHMTQGSWAARIAAKLAGYPDTEGALPLTLDIEQDGTAEIWHRDFDGHPVTSRQTLLPDGRIAERLGPAAVLMRPEATPEALTMHVAGLRTGPLPLPSLLSGGGIETAEGEAVRFDVTARLPGLGLLIRYHGVLHPV